MKRKGLQLNACSIAGLHTTGEINVPPAAFSTLLGKDIQIIHNDNFSLAFTGQPIWHINGKLVRPVTTNAFNEITNLYACDKSQFLYNLHGHFAVLLTDIKNNICLAASDRVGVHRLYYSKAQNNKLLISTSLAALRASHQTTAELSATSLYCYMYFHMVPTPFSIYPDIEKIPPGHCLKYENGDIDIEPYWMPQFTESSEQDIKSLSANLHQILNQSVKDCLGDETNYATFLSGGLDSSTVTGVASEITNQAVHTYSIGFNAKEYDETPFAREVAKHFGTQHHEYFVTPQDIVNAIPKIAACYDEPFGNSSALPTYYCAKVAAENDVKLMLAGDGGDELFAGNSRYASQRHYQHYQALPRALRKGLFNHLINALPAQFPLATKAQNYIKQADIPLPDRLQIYNFLHRHDPQEIFNKDFLKTVDTKAPLQLLRDQFKRPENASDLNRMLYLDWQFTLADNDLRKVCSMCELAGVRVAFPLLTDNLINFSCSLPSSLKLKKGKLRYFYRFAMQEFLPQATLNKSKHGFGLPFGIWLKHYKPLYELAQDSLEKLKTRHYFNPDFIDKTCRMHNSGDASYYGELIWIMMMLELWISTHHDQKKFD